MLSFKTPLTIFACFLFSWCQAQSDTTVAYFVEFNDGLIKKANTLRIESSSQSFTYALLNIDDTIRLNALRAYQDKTGYYQKFPVAGAPTPVWLKRDIAGKINLYNRLTSTSHRGNTYSVSSRVGFTPSNSPVQKIYYLQSGNEMPVKMNYRTLYPAVASVPEAAELVKRGRKHLITKATVTIVGSAVFLGGVIHSINFLVNKDQGQPFGIQHFSPFVLVGAGIVVGSYFLPNEKTDYKKAVLMFNGL